jgi:hypothetical protein
MQQLQECPDVNQLRVHLSLSSQSGEFASIEGEPFSLPSSRCQCAVPGHFSQSCRVEASSKGLHSLLNAAVVVSVHDTASGMQLATALVDMLPFAFGMQTFSCASVQLLPSPPEAEKSSIKVS